MASTLKDDIIVNPSDLFAQISNTATTAPYSLFTLPLGSRATTGDGRDFRLVQAGASNLIVGQLLQGPVIPTTLQAVTAVAAPVGATTTTLTISSGTAYTQGQLTGYYFQTYGTVANGGGQSLLISSNTAVTSGGTSITITLSDAVQTAITTSASVNVLPNLYAGVIQMPTTQTNAAVGVALGVGNNASTATTNGLTANYYGWVQVKGVSNALIQGTPASFTALSASTTTAGAFEEITQSTSASNYQLATNLATGVNGQYGPIDLLIS